MIRAILGLLASTALVGGTTSSNAAVVAAPLTNLTATNAIVNVEDDSGLLNNANWFTFHATAGSVVGLSVNRLAAPPDLCADLYFGNVNGLDFGTRSADCFSQNGAPELQYLQSQDDTVDDAFGGPFGDPRFSFTVTQTGTYSLVVTTLDLGIGSPFEVVARNIDSTVPEPGTLALVGLAGLAFGVKRRSR